ncbi:MAG: response regulator transcription factor [Verrucomicrobiota bacterium]
MILSRTPLLMVSGDSDATASISGYLDEHGFKVHALDSGEKGLQRVPILLPELLLVDTELPDMRGFEFFKRLYSDEMVKGIPVIFLSKEKNGVDAIIGLELGAEDFVSKDCSPREIGLRIRRSISRRLKLKSEVKSVVHPLQVGKLKVCQKKKEVSLGGKSVYLRPMEFKLLAFLMEKPGEVHSYPKILAQVWNYNVKTRGCTVYTHVRRLKKKLGQFSHYIENVRGVGLKIKEIPI